ncbi:MAG: hypothetical protein GX810_08315 [Clostridiales bacterium]|nr:hypothetical protein [Clostridiales bacterium]
MNIKQAKFSEEEKTEILQAQKTQHPVHVNKRLLALKLKAVDGMRSKDIGKIANMHATNEIFRGLEAVIDRLCQTVRDLAEDTQRVASITYRKWIIDALMI